MEIQVKAEESTESTDPELHKEDNSWEPHTGWWARATPSWKMMEFVNWDDDIPNPIYFWENTKNGNQTTNQIYVLLLVSEWVYLYRIAQFQWIVPNHQPAYFV